MADSQDELVLHGGHDRPDVVSPAAMHMRHSASSSKDEDIRVELDLRTMIQTQTQSVNALLFAVGKLTEAFSLSANGAASSASGSGHAAAAASPSLVVSSCSNTSGFAR